MAKDDKLNIICKLCYDKGVHFAVPRTKLGEAQIELHFIEEHPIQYQRYLDSRDKSN